MARVLLRDVSGREDRLGEIPRLRSTANGAERPAPAESTSPASVLRMNHAFLIQFCITLCNYRTKSSGITIAVYCSLAPAAIVVRSALNAGRDAARMSFFSRCLRAAMTDVPYFKLPEPALRARALSPVEATQAARDQIEVLGGQLKSGAPAIGCQSVGLPIVCTRSRGWRSVWRHGEGGNGGRFQRRRVSAARLGWRFRLGNMVDPKHALGVSA
jgi:hypothetical protein